jgi:hypothetical protein
MNYDSYSPITNSEIGANRCGAWNPCFKEDAIYVRYDRRDSREIMSIEEIGYAIIYNWRW